MVNAINSSPLKPTLPAEQQVPPPPQQEQTEVSVEQDSLQRTSASQEDAPANKHQQAQQPLDPEDRLGRQIDIKV